MSEPQIVESWESVPYFDKTEVEAQYWQSHQLHPKLLKTALYQGSADDSVTITIRIGSKILEQTKRMAAGRYLNYQSMMKQWIAERLEKELDGRGTNS